jgi:hypothetical protein
MSRPPGGSAGSDAARAGFAAGKGALLIGLAVIIGIVLLKQMPDNKSASAKSSSPTTKSAPKTTTTTPKQATTTTVAQAAAKTPAELRVIVLNGGAAAGAAGRMSETLKQKNYTNQAQASNWSGKSQSGNTVLCKPGLDREATALATTVGGGTPVTVQPWPTPPPPDTDGPPPVDCTVVVGSGTSA